MFKNECAFDLNNRNGIVFEKNYTHLSLISEMSSCVFYTHKYIIMYLTIITDFIDFDAFNIERVGKNV